MSKETAFLFITDLHWKEGNISGRFSYEKEQEHAYSEIVQTIFNYKSKGMDVVTVLLGDVNDRHYRVVEDSSSIMSRLNFLSSISKEMYMVIGNHETTYYKNNPIWSTMAEIHSEIIPRYLTKKIWQPRGVYDQIIVCDKLEVGNVRFIFNHHGCGVQTAPRDGKKNIGLFHTDLYAKAIVDDIRHNKGLPIFEHTPVYFDSSDILYGYDYCFFGHMHMLYGQWLYECERTGYQSFIEYLSTLGRTNHLEINNDFLERNIPAIIVSDGEFVRKEDNKFNLMTREQCVDEAIVLKNQEKTKKAKEVKAQKEHVAIVTDPIKNIVLNYKSSGRNSMAEMYEEIYNSGYSKVEKNLAQWVENL